MTTRIPVRLPGKRLKFRNKPTSVGGLKFDSEKEANRYSELLILQRAGKIAGLLANKRDVRFDLKVNGVEIGVYEADFIYGDFTDGFKGSVVEDVKGLKTREYLMKKRLMKALYNIEIREI